METVISLWKKYNKYSEELSNELGRTRNIVGEYAEHLVNLYLKGELLAISESSADIKTDDGKLYQVKSRKVSRNASTQLNVIRSWDFDFLVVVIFNLSGDVTKAIMVPVDIAKEFGVSNKHQNGWVITTNKKFLKHHQAQDITKELKILNHD